MDPWSKVDYSRHIREVSMVEGKLPEVDAPSGRVLGRVLTVLPILDARRRRNRGEIAKKDSVFGGFASRRINRRRGAARGPLGAQAPPGATRPLAAPGGRLGAWWCPLALLRASGGFRHADFLSDFSQIFGALFIWGKSEIEKQQKT